jgi:hypothetical protein
MIISKLIYDCWNESLALLLLGRVLLHKRLDGGG